MPPLEMGTGQQSWCVPGKWELLFYGKKEGTMASEEGGVTHSLSSKQ